MHMLPAKHRLQKDTDISKVLAHKRGVFDAACGVKYATNGLEHSRFAVIAGTKVSKNAVDRNKMKRQYREIVHKILPKLKPGFDVMLLIGKPALDLPYEQKKQRLERVLARAGIIQHR